MRKNSWQADQLEHVVLFSLLHEARSHSSIIPTLSTSRNAMWGPDGEQIDIM